MEACCCKFHAQLIGDIVKGHKVGGIPVLYCHAEAYILKPHFFQLQQCAIAALKAVFETSYLIIGLFQSLYGNAYAYLGKFLCKSDYPVCEKAIGADDDTVGLLVQLPYDVGQVCAYKGLAACDVGEVHRRKLLYSLYAQLLLGL